MSITKINIFKNFAKIPLSFAVQNPVSAAASVGDYIPPPLTRSPSPLSASVGDKRLPPATIAPLGKGGEIRNTEFPCRRKPTGGFNSAFCLFDGLYKHRAIGYARGRHRVNI